MFAFASFCGFRWNVTLSCPSTASSVAQLQPYSSCPCLQNFALFPTFSRLLNLIWSEEFLCLFSLLLPCRRDFLYNLLPLGAITQSHSKRERRIIGSVAIMWCFESCNTHIARHCSVTRWKVIRKVCPSYERIEEQVACNPRSYCTHLWNFSFTVIPWFVNASVCKQFSSQREVIWQNFAFDHPAATVFLRVLCFQHHKTRIPQHGCQEDRDLWRHWQDWAHHPA